MCKTCVYKLRLKTDQFFTLVTLVRDRLRHGLKIFSKKGKVKITEEYGIDYNAIFEYLGPCPGKREEYHIDHIFPLSAFDFDNPKHIIAAFAPENHQWLKAEENLKKHAKYDQKEFEKYLKKFT